MKRLLLALAAFLAVAQVGVQGAWAAQSTPHRQPGNFDHYVLALSWSPSFCLAEAAKADARQCRTAKPFTFIVHGFWPQYDRMGGPPGPESCQRPAPYVPEQTLQGVFDIMPSKGLILHEWRKHGTCSGLSPEAYFALLRRAYERIVLPPALAAPDGPQSLTAEAVEAAFYAANPGLEADMMAVTCSEGMMREVRICLDRDLAFRACPRVDRSACAPRRPLSVPAPLPR